MGKKQYYSVTTRKFSLRCGHIDWLRQTQDFYNEILLFYYHLFLELERKQPGRLTKLSNQLVLRELEICSIVGRNKQPVPYPLPWTKVPLYFRRSAINGACAAAKTYFSKKEAGIITGETQNFEKGVTYYKGMYQALTEQYISLKVWNGNHWTWMNCRLTGNFLPDKAEPLSPSVLLDNNGAYLLVPVREVVADGRRAVERIHDDTKLCSIQFTNEDTFAVGVVMDCNGEQTAIRFFKGGVQYQHLCKDVLDKIQRSESAMGLQEKKSDLATGEKTNKKYWMKLKHIKDYYAHSISRQIVEFSRINEVGIIILPKYNDKFTKYVMFKTGNWSPLHLSKKIRELVLYKAWKEGMIVLEVNSSDTSSRCALCGAPIRKKDGIYECKNGHKGSKPMNSARNLGRKCLKSFGKEIS